MTFSYDGTRYHGYQKQINDISIQEEIEKMLTKINSNEKVVIHATGRTDAGVHALNQKAHFDLKNNISEEKIKNSLNKLLPQDIYIKKVEKVSDDFHARYNVKSKEYVYKINTGEYNPLERNYVYQLNKSLNIELMDEALMFFVGEHNFKSFTKTTDEIKDYNRIIYSYKIEYDSNDKNIIIISLVGNGFLRYMVRNIVGTLVEVGLGLRSPNEIPSIFEEEDRIFSGKTAPACGLYLKNVSY